MQRRFRGIRIRVPRPTTTAQWGTFRTKTASIFHEMLRYAFPALLLAISVATVPPQEHWWKDVLPPVKDTRQVTYVPVVDASAAQLEMDAQLLAAVAKGEDPDAPVAVMWTVKNRMRESGKPLLKVVTEGQAYGTVKDGKFEPSWTLDPEERWWHPLDKAELHRLEGVAHAVLLNYIPDPTKGATHFHRKGTWEPPWAPPRAQRVTLGYHMFYAARW